MCLKSLKSNHYISLSIGNTDHRYDVGTANDLEDDTQLRDEDEDGVVGSQQ